MPDAAGNIKGIALSGKAGEVLDKIKKKEREPLRGYNLVACSCGCGNFPDLCPNIPERNT